MNIKPVLRHSGLLASAGLAAATLLTPVAAFAVDADAAQALARRNNCFRCHSVDKLKVGPAWKDVAAKLKGNKDAEDTLIKHLTGKGSDPNHPAAKGSAEDIKNLADWILSL